MSPALFEGKTVRKELLHSEAAEYSHSYPIASLKPGEYGATYAGGAGCW